MKVAFFYVLCLMLYSSLLMAQERIDCIKLSQDILYASKTDAPADSLQEIFKKISAEELTAQLKTDDERKAFWLNIYNAYTQLSLKQSVESYKRRGKFFSNKFIGIAGEQISLDIIEHGLLRRSKAKLFFGHFNKLFKSKFEKKFRLDKLDYRIHFALNCGAKSCPPIAFYKPEQIEKQLDLATKVYLKNEVLFNGKDLTVTVPVILSWFRRDFGGKKGIVLLLRHQRLIPENLVPGIRWKKYDWTVAANVFE
jgi:hypothetical protein